MTENREYGVKIRKPAQKGWHFYAGKGTVNRLRIHAMRYAQAHAQAAADALKEGNPSIDVNVIKF